MVKDTTGQSDQQVRPLRARGQARRGTILDTATTLFSNGGFNNVSLADIAREVGITQAGILYHFPTKAALLLAVLQERETRNIADRDRYVAEGIPPLEAYVRTLVDNDRKPQLVQLFVVLAAEATATDHPGNEWFIDRNTRLMESMTQIVRGAVDESALPAGVDAAVVTRWLLGLAHGLGAQWVFDPSAFDRAHHVELFLELLRPYLRSPACQT